MKVIRAHDGRSITVNQPLSQFHTLDDLLDCFSLATEIPSDAIICMTQDGSQLKEELVQQIAQQEQDRLAQPHSEPGLSSYQQQRQHLQFFVFNRDFLYTDAEALAAELAEAAQLEPAPVHLEIVHPPTPRSLESLVAWSGQIVDHLAVHESKSHDLVDNIGCMLHSTQVALLNLQSHSESIRKGADALAELAAKELARMQGLLDGHERDLQVLGMVAIHPRLLSAAGSSGTGSNGTVSSSDARSRAAVGGGGGKERNLGDYVSRVKMNAVADACTKVYSEIRERITALEEARQQLDRDTDALTNEVQGTDIAPSSETCQEAAEASVRAAELFHFIDATCSPNDLGWPAADKLDAATYDEVTQATDELLLLDEVGRQSVLRLFQDRNDMLARCLELLQDISSLQSEFADLGSHLAAVDADLHSNKVDGFKHLHRLKSMLWAYGATVLEVVRRREFAKHFLSKSQTLAELMAKLSATERKRRQQYRSDVFGQLPWEVKGIDEMAPSLEITTTRTGSGGDDVAELGRDDLEALLQLLDVVDQRLMDEGHVVKGDGPSAIQDVKAALQRLMAVLDDWEHEFVYLVHTQLLGDDDGGGDDGSEAADDDDSGSETSIRARARQRGRWKRLQAAPAPPDRSEIEALERQLQEERAVRKKDEEAAAEKHQTELDTLRTQLEDLQKELTAERSKNETLACQHKAVEVILDTVKADLELEKERRLNMADEVSHLRSGLEEARRAEAEARQEAIEESDHANEVETHLHEMQVELDEARAARLDASSRIEALLSEGSSAEQELRAAQQRIDELTEQVSVAHAETNTVRETIAEIEAAKEKQIRSHRAEADGDRAILEEKVRALKHDLHDQRIRTKRAEDGQKPDHEAIELLKGQLRAADDAHEEIVKEMEQARELADQAEAARREFEASRQQLLEAARPLLARSHQLHKAVRAMPALSSSSKGATASTSNGALLASAQQRSVTDVDGGSGSAMTMSVVSEAERQAAMEAFEAEAETADVDVTLEALRVFDPVDAFEEVKGKLDSLATLIRKWQKAYKSSNEKTQRALAAARDKISFRNFQAGDLALFLPTRNSTAKPWAAFNISFPHFFLRATGQLAEQLKTKEWIVARIVAITDQVATNVGKRDDDSDGNPFQLAEGVRFYLLDVETWNGSSVAPPALRSRKSSAALSSTAATDSAAKKDRMGERRKSDILSSRSIAERPEGNEEGKQPQVQSRDVAAEEDQRLASVSKKDKKAIFRRASEGDRPSDPARLSTIDNHNDHDDDRAHRSSTPPMVTPDGSPPRAVAPPSVPVTGRSERLGIPSAGPQTPSGGGPPVSPPLSSERCPRFHEAPATSLSQIAANATSPTRSTAGAPSALTRAILATSPVSLRGNGNGTGGARSWISRPPNDGGVAREGGSASLVMHPASAAEALEDGRDAGVGGFRTGMGISGSSFGGPPAPPIGHSLHSNSHGQGSGTVFGSGEGGGGDSSTSGSESKRSAIIERAAALPAFGRGSTRSARYESRRYHGGGLASAPASQTSRLYDQTTSVEAEAGPAPANPFSQSPSGANLSSSLANDRHVPLRKTTLSQRINAPLEESKVTATTTSGGGTAVEPAAPAPPKVQRWTDAAVPSAIPTMDARRGSSTAGRTSGFSLTSSPSTGTMGSPRGLTSSLAGPPVEAISKISTEQATGRSSLLSPASASGGGSISSARPYEDRHALASTSPTTTAGRPTSGGGGGGGGFLSQTLGRFSTTSVGGPPWSPSPGAPAGKDQNNIFPPIIASTSPIRSRRNRPSLDAVLQHPTQSLERTTTEETSTNIASGAEGSSSAASILLRRVGGLL